MLYLFCVYPYLLSLALTGQHSVVCWLHSINHHASPSYANEIPAVKKNFHLTVLVESLGELLYLPFSAALT